MCITTHYIKKKMLKNVYHNTHYKNNKKMCITTHYKKNIKKCVSQHTI